MNDPYDEIIAQQEVQQASYWETLDPPEDALELPENDPLLW